MSNEKSTKSQFHRSTKFATTLLFLLQKLLLLLKRLRTQNSIGLADNYVSFNNLFVVHVSVIFVVGKVNKIK